MRYPYELYKIQSAGHSFWIAKSDCLKGCVGQGDIQEDAISELEENETAWLETAKDAGIEIPLAM